MKAVVTGATGFFGRYLIASLLSSHALVAIARHRPETAPMPGLVLSDYALNHLAELFAGADVLIHLAGARPYKSEGEVAGNASLDHRVFAAAHLARVPRCVYVSSRSVYGQQPLPWREDTPVQPLTTYARGKLQGEQLAAEYRRAGMQVIVLRLAQLLGLGEYRHNAVSTFIARAYHRRPITLTSKGMYREYLYVKDAVTAIQAVIRHSAADGLYADGLYNVGSGSAAELAEIARGIAEYIGHGSPLSEAITNHVAEASLMDSSLFRKAFHWSPRYDIAGALRDIANDLRDEATARQYGIVQ